MVSELRGSIVADVMAFRVRLQDPSFVKSLSVQGEGSLRIHHAIPTGEKWYAVVTYDVQRFGDVEQRHYDINGKEVRLVAWGSGTK